MKLMRLPKKLPTHRPCRAAVARGAPRAAVAILLLLCVPVAGGAADLEDAQESVMDLTDLSLEELMDVEITSVAKKVQKLADAAAAVFVISAEDIRRSGVTSIPEALRMVPGLQVAHIDANKWAITSRGFNIRFATKLLVLIDGRTVYTPMWSGVHWNRQDTLLEDIERIEVIRGPGATLWGANAVNGVINIITKHAKDTQGSFLSAGAGTEERGFAGARHGVQLGENAYGRAYVKYFSRDSFVDSGMSDAADDWDVLRGGVRVDWQPSPTDSMILNGEIYAGDAGQRVSFSVLEPPYTSAVQEDSSLGGGHVLVRWERTLSATSDMTLQLYYDRTEHREALIAEDRDTVDIDFLHSFALGKRQEIMWGLAYRHTRDEYDGSFQVSFIPDSRGDDLFSAFVQDDITLLPDTLRLTLGSKFEHNDYTGSEIQPSGRLLWTPDEKHSLWAAISRAVRTPSRSEENVVFNAQVIPPLTSLNPGTVPIVVTVFGNDDLDSEELLAYELGYRTQASDRLSIDIAAFYNDYDNLITNEPGSLSLNITAPVAHYVMASSTGNKMGGETYGFELAAEWRVLDWWRLRPAYAYLEMQLDPDADSGDASSESIEGASPHNQFSLRSSLDLPGNVDFDLWFRYVDNLPTQGVASYLTLDTRLGWKVSEALELSVVGQNLIECHHPEFQPAFVSIRRTEVPRGMYAKITWRF